MLKKTKTKYRFFVLLAAMLMFFSGLTGLWSGQARASTVANPAVVLNGQKLSFEVPPVIENGRTLVPLRAIFESMGAKVYWNSITSTVTAVKGTTRVIMPLYSTKPTINGVVYNIDVPVKIVNNRSLAPLRFVCEAFGGTVSWDGITQTVNIVGEFSADPEQPPEPIVVLDPGHGGIDTGARGSRLDEKDVNLQIALKVGALLQQNGIKVEYTRSTDSYVGLEERSNIANKLNAAVFVSIHMNSYISSGPAGTETYFYAPAGNEELFAQYDKRAELARTLQTALVSALQRSNRGVKEANLSVLRNTLMPSALVEIVFISNPTEEALLATTEFKDRTAAAIANGIITFMTK